MKMRTRSRSMRMCLVTLAPGLLSLMQLGCGDRTLTISQDRYINTAMHLHRPLAEQTGDPLEVNIVCVSPEDLEKTENDRLKPGSGITAKEWYAHRPEVGGQQPGKFWLPSDQIYLLTNMTGLCGTVKGPSLAGSVEDGVAQKVVRGIKLPKKPGHRQSVIYVFPKFIGPDAMVLPTPPAVFNPPSAYPNNLAVEIGVQPGGSNHGQFIKNTTRR